MAVIAMWLSCPRSFEAWLLRLYTRREFIWRRYNGWGFSWSKSGWHPMSVVSCHFPTTIIFTAGHRIRVWWSDCCLSKGCAFDDTYHILVEFSKRHSSSVFQKTEAQHHGVISTQLEQCTYRHWEEDFFSHAMLQTILYESCSCHQAWNLNSDPGFHNWALYNSHVFNVNQHAVAHWDLWIRCKLLFEGIVCPWCTPELCVWVIRWELCLMLRALGGPAETLWHNFDMIDGLCRKSWWPAKVVAVSCQAIVAARDSQRWFDWRT